MEDYLLECLDVAVKAGDAPDKRRRKAMGTDAWNLLDRSWKGLLLVALNQEEGVAREASTRTSSRRMRNRGRRALNSNTDDWIEGVDGLVASHAPPGYRLSAMLVQRVRLGERWNPDWDIEIEKMRESCADGIHPVWPRLGQEAPILAEMAMYPIIEISTQIEIDSTEWIQAARFDPMERTALASWLEITPPFSLTAKLELAIQRMAKSFRAKGKIPKLSDALDDLVGEAVLIRALARVCTQSEGAMDDLSTLSGGGGMIAAVAQDQLTLLKLRGGDESAWQDCRAADGDDPLAAAMRYQSWMSVPEEVLLAAVEIQEGVSILNEGDDTHVLLWNLVAAHLREGNLGYALENVASLDLIDQSRLGVILELIEKSEDEGLVNRLNDGIHRFENVGLQTIMEAEKAPLNLRSTATIELQNRDHSGWERFDELALDIFTEVGDAIQIGSILMDMENGAAKHPHRTLLVHHLLPGDAKQELCGWIQGERSTAIEALTNEPSGVLSDTSIGLVKLLEGAPADLAAIQRKVGGNREAIRAFNQCRQAMMKGGDGLVPADRLEKLQSSIETSSLRGVELRLFMAVLDRLRFNRAMRLLEDHREESTLSAISTLENVVGKNPRKQIVDGVRQVVLEHDSIGIPALSEWHRKHSASSSWHQVILASIDEMNGNYRSAGRALYRASLDTKTFNFEHRLGLARRALIAFAHAGQFSEAVGMLESQQALQSALTGQFQLYLNVCNDAQRQQPESSRHRLLNWVSQTVVVVEENEDGESIEKERTTYPSDELDLLFTYPNSRGLPKEPWQGRVRSAIRGIKEKRSQRSLLEDRFRQIFIDKPTVQEIEAVARDAAKINPTQGLMMFERAVDRGVFSINEEKALLRSQNGIFRLNEDTLPIRVRSKLRRQKLKPLIVVDTNLLIDSAKEYIGLLLDAEGRLDTNAHGTFHRTVLNKANAGMVELMVPNAAEHEFRGVMSKLGRVRSLFDDVWLDNLEWEEKVNQKAIDAICKQVLSDFNVWRMPDDPEHEAKVAVFEERMVQFLLTYRGPYSDLTDSKAANNPKSLKNRTKIKGKPIYPERGDRDIMRMAAMLADSTHRGIGAILVASRDGDFTLVHRSLEEEFGFGVVSNARELSQWA